MKPPTDKEIREEVYANTFQETGDEIEGFIKGMIYMRNKWNKSIDDGEWIYEREGDNVYMRPWGSEDQRVLVRTLTELDMEDWKNNPS